MNGGNGYLLDTNVLSELRKLRRSSQVVSWLASLESSSVFLSVLTLGELHRGVEMKRRSNPVAAMRIGVWVDSLESTYADRILSFDLPAAQLWGILSADRTRPIVDLMIAATALVHELTLVTRNTAHVQGLSLALFNPWDQPD